MSDPLRPECAGDFASIKAKLDEATRRISELEDSAEKMSAWQNRSIGYVAAIATGLTALYEAVKAKYL